MRGRRPTLLLTALALALVVTGALLPVALLYVAGVVLGGVVLVVAVRRRLPLVASVAAAVAVGTVAVAVPWLTAPRTSGLTGEWAAPAIDGEVLSGRALVGEDNTSIDLVTGKTVRLGSVTGGARWVADDRMLVVRDDRVDSVRLDASERWTWRPPAARSVKPLAAADGMTVLRLCPPAGGGTSCELTGIDARGRAAWTTEAPGQQATSPALTGPAGSLPRVAVLVVPGSGGSFLVDPASGRRTLVPSAATLAVPDGPVVVSSVSGGRCVTSLYAALSPAWTSVSPAGCTSAVPSRWFTGDGQLWVERAGSWERYAMDSGARRDVEEADVPDAGQPATTAGDAAATRRLAAYEDRKSLFLNPFRSSDDVSILTLRDARTDEVVARLVSEDHVDLLHAETGAVVVREGDRVVRYVVGDT